MTLYDLNGKTIYAGSRPIEKVYLGSNLLIHNKPTTYLAQDSDFSGTSNGAFKYIGKHLYVEIPHVIKGVSVTSYNGMFEGTSVKGVVSTNSRVTSMTSTFRDSQATSLDLSSFDTSNVTNMFSMFRNSQATTLDLSSFDTSRVTSRLTNDMFMGSKATTGYARTRGDADKFNSSRNKPSQLRFIV